VKTLAQEAEGTGLEQPPISLGKRHFSPSATHYPTQDDFSPNFQAQSSDALRALIAVWPTLPISVQIKIYDLAIAAVDGQSAKGSHDAVDTVN
jgi:hypothetical protein